MRGDTTREEPEGRGVESKGEREAKALLIPIYDTIKKGHFPKIYTEKSKPNHLITFSALIAAICNFKGYSTFKRVPGGTRG